MPSGPVFPDSPLPVILPMLSYAKTEAQETRGGHPVTLVVVHRWGVRYTNEEAEKASYGGVVNFFMNPANRASAHVVYPGSAAPGLATQMVGWNEAAWAEAAYNRGADDVESADAIWLGADPVGLAQLARIVAARCHYRNLPAVWSTQHGFCRHADLGAAGGGHTACPTTDLTLWRQFVSLVQAEFHRGGFRPSWGFQ